MIVNAVYLEGKEYDTVLLTGSLYLKENLVYQFPQVARLATTERELIYNVPNVEADRVVIYLGNADIAGHTVIISSPSFEIEHTFGSAPHSWQPVSIDLEAPPPVEPERGKPILWLGLGAAILLTIVAVAKRKGEK